MSSLRDFQGRLRSLGHDPGPLDGIWGAKTAAAANAALDRLPSPLRTSVRGMAALAHHEGFVPGPYLDGVGVWTVYIGHTASAGAPDPKGMTRGMPSDLDAALAEGFRVFLRDLRRYEDRVAQAFTVPLERHQWDAAVSFDFNTGGINRALWVRAWNEGRRADAADLMMNWRTPRAVIPRRTAERDLLIHGRYPDVEMPVWPVDEHGRITWRPVRVVDAADVERMLMKAAG